MKINLLCLFIAINWALTLADPLAIAPKEETPAKEETPVLPKDTGSKPATPDNHNVDLSKTKTPEKEAVEKEDDGPAVFDVRQTIFNGYENLKWKEFTGSAPQDGVYIYNQYTRRNEYVCAVSMCAIGFYTSSKGSFCYYAGSGTEYRSSTFKILVNEQNFEVLEWQRQSHGNVPSNAVQRCQGMYVGKTEYGLGNVIPSTGVISVPYNGFEYLYDNYEVLRLYPDYHSQSVNSLTYNLNQVFYDEDRTVVLGSQLVVNRGCNTLTKTVSLSETTPITKYWDIGRPTNRNVGTSFNGNMPVFSGSSISYSNIPQFEWQEGFPYTQSKQNTYNLHLTVKPNHECEVVLQGRNLHLRMPFTASLSRSYNNGQTRSASMQGTFYNLQTDDVVIYSKPCKRIINVPPCF